MAEKLLGVDFAIHGGGSDLVFPHHENEIAQTEAARGAPLARIWMHNGMVRTDEEKMSKSVGNIFQLSEAIERFGAEALVAYLISGHYRQPLEFSEQALAQARATAGADPQLPRRAGPCGRRGPVRRRATRGGSSPRSPTTSTPRARWAELFELINEGNRRALPGARAALAELLELLGLESLLESPAEPADAEARGAAGRARSRPRGA